MLRLGESGISDCIESEKFGPGMLERYKPYSTNGTWSGALGESMDGQSTFTGSAGQEYARGVEGQVADLANLLAHQTAQVPDAVHCRPTRVVH